MMGVFIALVGFASSFAVVLQGLEAVGASNAQAVSALFALSLAIGVCAIVLAVATRKPVSVAWSTPGAALLATAGTPDGGFAAAVGAFIVCGVLLTLTGLSKRFAGLVSSIPNCLANAMLAGILFGLCLAPVRAVAEYPAMALPIVLAWLVVGRFNKLLAVPAALLVYLGIVAFVVDLPENISQSIRDNLVAAPLWVTPEFTWQAMINISLPLFLVTVASQNIPGIAVLNINNYHPSPQPLFLVCGLFSLLSAPWGGHAVNLAAITAAMGAGEDAHPDPQRRYWAVIVSGVCYLLLGLFAGLVIHLLSLAPSLLLPAVAGLALVAACSNSLVAAFQPVATRDAAAVTFFVTAAGLSIAGIASAFWGLVAGALVYSLRRRTDD